MLVRTLNGYYSCGGCFMDVTPTGQSPNQPARGKSATKTKADTPKVTVKPARSRKAPANQPETTVDASELSQSIATTAYFLAAARNFEPGHELEDWLEAERRVQEAAAQ
jgi:hypothetical protein